ncbi:MAG: glycosyltransferase family 2 protein [Francisella endosymbiont of Hyalomma asiaticum]
MSVYNAEKYIAQAIESILQQSFKDFEFIIVNDGSTDNSLAIIKKYEEIDSQIRIIS